MNSKMTMGSKPEDQMMAHKPKVLFTASIAKHILRFHLPYLEWFQKKGFETHVACNGDEDIPFCDKKWSIPFVRSPYSAGHLKAKRELEKVMEREKYELIHCHTPMASILTRLAAKKSRKNGTKVIYTAHGFHFFKGGPLFNWLSYYPVELLMSKYTDALITINHEDFDLIRRKGASETDYYLIPGVGVEAKKFHPVSEKEKISLRLKNGFNPDDFILIYAAEFIFRKNHEFIVESAPKLFDRVPNCKILFAGRGELQEDIQRTVEKKDLQKNIVFLGFRDDIDEIFKLSDVGISTSRQEGLGLNLVEEMMCGLPVVAAIDRGHREVVDHEVNGFLFKQNNSEEFVQYLKQLFSDKELYAEMSEKALHKAAKFELTNAVSEMAKIYDMILDKKGNLK